MALAEIFTQNAESYNLKQNLLSCHFIIYSLVFYFIIPVSGVPFLWFNVKKTFHLAIHYVFVESMDDKTERQTELSDNKVTIENCRSDVQTCMMQTQSKNQSAH